MAERALPARMRARFDRLPRRRKVLVAFVALGLAVLVALLIRFLLRPPPVEVDVVRRENVVRILALTGEIAPVARVEIVPEATGELIALPVAEGDIVGEGQLLARLESAEPRAQLDQARAALAAQRDELEQARRETRRAERLQAAGAVAEQEMEQARLAADQAAARVRELQARVEEIEAVRGRYVIDSPIAGVVLERPVDPGQVVGPEDVIYEIATAGARRVEAEADERYVDELAVGMVARIAPVGRDRVYEGRVSFIDEEVDPETGAVTVRLQFEDMPPWLVFGLSVDVNIVVARRDRAITVARAAVADIDTEPWVLEVVDGETVRRAVDVIDWPSARVVVETGLEAGDVVVLLPEQVPAGEAVRPISPGEDAVEDDAL